MMKQIRDVLSLCDGISTTQLSLQMAGVDYDNYYASEINKYPIKVAKANFPETIHVGDLFNISGHDYKSVDLVLAGFPCQSFSLAGKELNFHDPRGKIFFECVRILNEVREHNPNVKFLFENVKMKKEFQDVISKHIGCQPIFLNSNLVSAQNRGRNYWTNINITSIPEDEGVLLQDIVDESIALTEKSQCILSTIYKENVKSMIKRGKKGLYVAVAKRGKNEDGVIKQSVEVNPYGKGNCLTTVQKDSMLGLVQGDDFYYRKFTVEECEKLQTLPVGFTACLSDTQRYKAIGEGWTAKMIAHFFRSL